MLRSSPCSHGALGRLSTAPLVGEVRTVGLTGAVELSAEARAANPGVVEAVVTAARRHGVLTRVVRGVALQVSPAFVITEAEIDTMTDALEAALHDVAAAA